MSTLDETDKVRLKIWLAYSFFGLILSSVITFVLDDILGILDSLFISGEGIVCGTMTLAMGLALDKFSKSLKDTHSP